MADRPGEPARPAKNPSASAPVDSAHAQTEDEVPQLLGEFRLIRRLGRGGMAEVFLAEQVSLKRNVAVKVLRAEYLADAVQIKRFETEAKAAAGLNHANIVGVYTIGSDSGVNYIAQEYVQGQNLKEFVQRKGPPELNVVLHIMRQVAAALQAAGEAGIVHRDIKPENIMITRKGDVKVADFGLAQLTQGGAEPLNLTRENTTVGTPLYMSPEQVNGQKLDSRSDIYSFGVTCYYLLAGRPPFRGETALSVAIQHVKNEPEALSSLRPELPPLLCKIVHKMLAKPLGERYQSAQEVLKDLKRLKQEGSNAQSEPTGGSPAKTAARGSNLGPVLWKSLDGSLRRHALTFFLSVLLFGSVGAGLGWAFRTPDPLKLPVTRQANVPPKDTATEQFLYAMEVNTTAAWQAVIDRFPNERLVAQRAREKLALLYFVQRRYDEAQAEFATLSRVPADPVAKAFGAAGEAAIFTVRKDYRRSQELLTKVKPHFERLDSRMQEVVRKTLTVNQAQLQNEAEKGWEKILGKPPETD